MTDEDRVIVSLYSDCYHLSESGFYAVCGADFNPHHAAFFDRGKVERIGFDPCPDCYCLSPDDPRGEGPQS